MLNLRHGKANVFSHRGDSGGVVYLMATGQLMGPLFGGNNMANDLDNHMEVSYITKDEKFDEAVQLQDVGWKSTWALHSCGRKV